jgi:hypothetical protein
MSDFKDSTKDELFKTLIAHCEATTGVEASKQTRRLLRSAVKSLNFKEKKSAQVLPRSGSHASRLD